MKIVSKISFFLLVLVINSCGTRKDTILSRNYQALTTKYNVLFNGKEALNEGLEEINNDFNEDWFERLPIEPIKFEENTVVAPRLSSGPGTNFGDSNEQKKSLSPFEIAEDKAVKAIQKHGMNIDGLERNNQIDDAYLLLGKSRYYQQRFIPAIEAFNYIIGNYPSANLLSETKIWRAKANIRIDNEERAIETMNLLLYDKDTVEANLPEEIKEQGFTALAMAYIKTDSLQNAKKSLQLATRTLKIRNQGARNLFILGQLYSEEGKKDSASLLFKRLINFKKAPFNYKVRANIELAKNVTNDSTRSAVLKTLNKMIDVIENRPYLDQLYYQKAQIHERKDSINLAIKYYNKSLRANTNGKKQKSFTYEKLASIFFKKSNYLKASAYYDSVLQNTSDTLNLRVRRVKRKYSNLASLIKFENTIIKNDSILRIANLTDEEKKVFFESYVDSLKKADEAAAQLRLNQIVFANNGNGIIAGSAKGNWYFYNSQSLSFGKNEFRRIWGDRKLQDNWRWSSATEEAILDRESKTLGETAVNDNYNVELYISKIPTSKSVLDSIAEKRNNALYESGLIYKAQFKDYNLAEARLLRALDVNTNLQLELPINWHLYQLFKQTEQQEKALQYKNVILKKFPDTQFAKILKNPEANLENQEEEVNEVEDYYKEMYYLFKSSEFKKVIENIQEYVKKIPNSKLLPKFELLKALSIGKSLPKEEYISALGFVSVTFGNTKEGERAQQLLDQLLKK